jgi:hypothetical protein
VSEDEALRLCQTYGCDAVLDRGWVLLVRPGLTLMARGSSYADAFARLEASPAGVFDPPVQAQRDLFE